MSFAAVPHDPEKRENPTQHPSDAVAFKCIFTSITCHAANQEIYPIFCKVKAKGGRRMSANESMHASFIEPCIHEAGRVALWLCEGVLQCLWIR